MKIEIEDAEVIQLEDIFARKLKERIDELERENRRLKQDIIVQCLNKEKAKIEFYQNMENCLCAYDCQGLVGRYYTNNQLLNHLFYFLECSKAEEEAQAIGEINNVNDM